MYGQKSLEFLCRRRSGRGGVGKEDEGFYAGEDLTGNREGFYEDVRRRTVSERNIRNSVKKKIMMTMVDG